jgi:hypothetical protein
VGLERGPLSLMSTIEELLGRKSIGSGLESREYSRRDLTSVGRSVGIVHLHTQATDFSYGCVGRLFSRIYSLDRISCL